MFPMSVPITFKIAATASLVESLFSKVTGEISAFCNSVENSIICIGIIEKVALLVISINSLLTGAVGFQSTSCNATKKELLTKFLQGVSNISKNLQEEFYSGVTFK